MYSSRNPFLEMLAAIGDEDEAQQKPSGSSLQQQQQQRPGKVQLDKFWPQAPNAWFATAELKLKVANITGERERALCPCRRCHGFQRASYCYGPHGAPAVVDPYTTLKGRLVLAHQLTPVQKATRCLQVVADSNQRLAEVLTSLLEFCPPGEERTAFFRAAFKMRLLVAIQAHLAGTELTDLKELAQMKDCLWLCHAPQPVAAI